MVSDYVVNGWPAKLTKELQPYHTRKQEITMEDDCLLWGVRVIIPKSLETRLLSSLHEDHAGISRMKSIARSYFWWKGLDEDIERVAKSCKSCLEQKSNPPKAPLHPWIWPTTPWKRIHIDYAGPFLNKLFLIVVDAHSKWPEVLQMTSTTSARTRDGLRTHSISMDYPSNW